MEGKSVKIVTKFGYFDNILVFDGKVAFSGSTVLAFWHKKDCNYLVMKTVVVEMEGKTMKKVRFVLKPVKAYTPPKNVWCGWPV